MNTGDSDTICEHWVAIKMTKHSCFYFDSFGLEILDENIKKFASNYYKVIYSNCCIQDYRSEKCGQFCIAFLSNVKTVNQYNHFENAFIGNLHINNFIANKKNNDGLDKGVGASTCL